ncbi:site-specific tyrosine recombinase/integron integrase [Zunongwangia endophytica]|uniref:Site-specific tyrosine recombinase/integron integrase n=1 Tax=Zunongwangia endophytica TaxID=1808945 RepID=A0ABV8HF00_9FLAO|nr:site-specific tyrosine recombinase/integron integrase [Zunongwangia endophytica]MDN3594162.1 tyrosine-type recombinase/integrase [Zunongwangia endophytica]
MNKSITLTPLIHRGTKQIAIKFDNDQKTRVFVKSYKDIKWSQSQATYYIGYSPFQFIDLKLYCRKAGFILNRDAFRNDEIPEYIPNPIKRHSGRKPTMKILYQYLPKNHQFLLKDYVGYLRGKRLSESTIKSYGFFVLRFLDLFKFKPVNEYTNRDLDYFMTKVMAEENYSISSHRQGISAFKYLTELCGFEEFDASEYERPKKSRYLPIVLSDREVLKLIQVTRNLKHRAIIALLYSAGLRIGELLNLKRSDIDFSRNVIHVKQGKNRKDRVVNLSETVKPLLNNYLMTYEPRNFLIEGRDYKSYTPSSVRNFLKISCKQAGISKRVTPHTLRHSYATHMLENGVDIRYIQELLGHSKPETTMIYTHVAQKDLNKIKNPLDLAVERITNIANGDEKVLISGN